MAEKKTENTKYRLKKIAGVILLGGVFAVLAQVPFEPSAIAQSTSQTANPAPAQTQPPAHSTPRRPRHRRTSTAAAPPGTTSSSNPPSGETAAQKAQDQRLLNQQQAASMATKQVNDQQVQQYDAAKQKVQNEPRIQDAPGPAETPRAPVTPDPTGIQEAPGPAQTAPAQPAPQAAPPQI